MDIRWEIRRNIPQRQLAFLVIDFCFTTESFNMTNEETMSRETYTTRQIHAQEKNVQKLCRSKVNQM